MTESTPSDAPRARSAGAAPQQLGRYELTEMLGVGGMAEVFRARTSGPGGFERTVVVKRILPANCEDPEFVRMFIAEAKILGMLHHPNVVQAYDFGEADGTLFLVLEYVDGPSLARAMRALRTAGRSMPLAVAAHVAHEVCRALDYVHDLRDIDGKPLDVIHRDVTPSNIVFTKAGAAKLLDFGVAKYGTSEARTQHRAVKGKPAYLAPEALEGKPFDHRVDVFSLGIVLYEMLTLTGLFVAENELVTMRNVLEMPIPRPSERRPEVPAALDAIVMKALERDLAKRYANAAEMARDLNEFVLSSQLHTDEVVAFVRDVEDLAARPRPSLAAIMAGSADTLPAKGGSGSGSGGGSGKRGSGAGEAVAGAGDDGPTASEHDVTKRDLGLRFRMSKLGRFIFGNDR